MTWIKHLLAIALAAAMLFMGLQKFGAENVIFQTIADNTGLAFFEPGFRMFSGVLEVLAGLLMFHPRTRGAGALLSTGIVAGAVVFHLSPWLGMKVVMAPGTAATYTGVTRGGGTLLSQRGIVGHTRAGQCPHMAGRGEGECVDRRRAHVQPSTSAVGGVRGVSPRQPARLPAPSVEEPLLLARFARALAPAPLARTA